MSSLLNIFEKYLLDSIVNQFDLELIAKNISQRDSAVKEDMLHFEDVTWDTYFANMKIETFYGEGEIGQELGDATNFEEFVDFIHGIDTNDFFVENQIDIQQIIGILYLEVWNEIKRAIIDTLTHPEFVEKNLLETINDALIGGFQNVLHSYEEYLDVLEPEACTQMEQLIHQTKSVYAESFGDEKALVRNVYVSIVKAAEELICNPECLQLGHRFHSALRYLVSGVSFYMGEKVSEAIFYNSSVYDTEWIQELQEYLPIFISTVVSCYLLIQLDYNPLLVALVQEFDMVPTVSGNIAYYRENAEKFERFAAELAKLNFEQFEKEVMVFAEASKKLEQATTAEELNGMLLEYYKQANKELPWGNQTVEEHFKDASSRLVFQ